ncbi:MAG: hypothetical protein M3425_03865 [Actinomycetota bacterium]|nr:hypothetical protein [Actinomycetota bacterium]
MDALGLAGALEGIRTLTHGRRISGRIHTVRLGHADQGDPSAPPVHLGAKAIEACQPGDVIAVANDGRTDSGAWGGLLSVAAKLRGVAGVVIDGVCRDVDEASDLDFAVFACGATPLSARGRTVELATDQEVVLAGISARPGDFVVADGTGVVLVPAAHAEAVVTKAETLAHREQELLAKLHDGASVTTVLDHRYEHMLHDGAGQTDPDGGPENGEVHE